MGDLKMNFKKYFILSLHLALAGPALGATDEVVHTLAEKNQHIHGLHEECPLPKNTQDIIDCALDLHPSVKKAALIVDSTSKLELEAAQMPNPTLSSRYIRGEQNNEDVSELETNLSFTLELGDKRAKRVDFAVARNEQALVENEALKADVKMATILNLHRLRQVLEEKSLLAESSRAFAKVIEQLKKLPRLSAEQEASLTLFEMSLEETKINESELFEEERKLEHYFHVATGHSLEEIQAYLPSSPKKWPSIAKEINEQPSPEIKKLNSLASLAMKELEVQKSKAWPDLSIGPSFAIEKEGSQDNKMIGFNIQIPIPIFQTNSGGKAYAQSELTRAQRNIALTLAEESHERFEQLKVYESAVSILNKTMNKRSLEKKHQRIENLHLRGVVSSSVFLDSLKQRLSYIKSRHSRELTALRALWSIHKYDGQIFQETI